MASIKRVTHKSGRVVYRIAICMGYDSSGNKLVKNMTCPVDQSATPGQQKKEALRFAMIMEDRIKYGYSTGPNKELFEDFARQWLANVKSDLAYGTYVGYEHLLIDRIIPYFKGYRVSHIRTADIEAFYRVLAQEYAPGTIRRYGSVLSCIFKTARRWNLIEDDPCRYAQKPKGIRDSEDLRYFTPSQVLMFLRSLDLTYDTSRSGRRYVVSGQYKVFYALSLFCGFRKGETLALRWEDIDYRTQEISINKSIGRTENGFDYKAPKNMASVRKVPFPDCVLTLLNIYRMEYDALQHNLGDKWSGKGNLFIQADGKLMGPNTPYQHFVRHLEHYNQWVQDHSQQARDQGLEMLPVIPLHGLRHSCATLLNYLEVNIVDISKYLGHANCSTTMDIYAHSFAAQKQATCNKLNEFIQTNHTFGIPGHCL
ncbi:MAG: site-specific integrase [bacterium]|nr:site-specific integrase [bacterium]MCM1375586.1 site-specific integrase [Muribaculum sp.]